MFRCLTNRRVDTRPWLFKCRFDFSLHGGIEIIVRPWQVGLTNRLTKTRAIPSFCLAQPERLPSFFSASFDFLCYLWPRYPKDEDDIIDQAKNVRVYASVEARERAIMHLLTFIDTFLTWNFQSRSYAVKQALNVNKITFVHMHVRPNYIYNLLSGGVFFGFLTINTCFEMARLTRRLVTRTHKGDAQNGTPDLNVLRSSSLQHLFGRGIFGILTLSQESFAAYG